MSKLPNGRRAGACLHVGSLPGRYGIGEIGREAQRFIDSLRSMDMSVWQFLPIGATGDEPSPYQPTSIYAGNRLLIDVADLIDAGLVDASDAVSLTTLPVHEIDYEHLIPRKKTLLKLAAQRFLAEAAADQLAEFENFIAQHDARWLHNFALFEVLRTMHHGRAWPEWDTQYVHRENAALGALEASAKQEILQSKVLQFLFFQQWQTLHDYAREQGVALFGDVPIYVPLDSAEIWENPKLVQIDRDGHASHVAGVPPDYFSTDGQRWGVPLYDWHYHATSGYQWWVQRMRHAMTVADIVRLDHFRAFESYWSIPATSATARDGEWLPGPGDALFDALREELGELAIVAEDLGMVTDAVTALRERQRFPGMQVLQFLLPDEHFDVSQIPANSVCYTGTHDNDTSSGWFRTTPDENVLRNTGGTAASLSTDIIKLALSSEAHLCIIMVQDLLGLGSAARMNTPGTNRGNWRWRVQSEQLDPVVLAAVREMVVVSGRSA